jgi:hypothetical protein
MLRAAKRDFVDVSEEVNVSPKASLKLGPVGIEDLRLNYNPDAPHARFKATGVEVAQLSLSERLPSAIPWPAATKPIPAPQHTPPITPALTSVNAARVVGGRSSPTMWAARQDTIVTTDYFGFDDSTDHFKLQGLGQCCDTGDAMVGNAM